MIAPLKATFCSVFYPKSTSIFLHGSIFLSYSIREFPAICHMKSWNSFLTACTVQLQATYSVCSGHLPLNRSKEWFIDSSSSPKMHRWHSIDTPVTRCWHCVILDIDTIRGRMLMLLVEASQWMDFLAMKIYFEDYNALYQCLYWATSRK